MARITQASDPDLWQSLYDGWVASAYPHIVTRGTEYYQALSSTVNEIEFETMTQLELYDSRSIKGSKPASYKKLDNG